MGQFKFRDHTIATRCKSDWSATIFPPNARFSLDIVARASLREGEQAVLERARNIIALNGSASPDVPNPAEEIRK